MVIIAKNSKYLSDVLQKEEDVNVREGFVSGEGSGKEEKLHL